MCRRTLHSVGPLVIVLFLAGNTLVGDAFAQAIDPAVRAGVAAGLTRVIVQLRITPPFTPEGDLPGPAAVEAQRRTIARTQDEILARLAGSNFSLGRKYDGLPMMALEIGPDALARLESAGNLVAGVLPDSPRFRQP